ncbi:hypothetical protein [Vibrio hangzhouensis]|uniref:Uncharacterized protein n=1 Tax=Vibrio hangzhouensis TaxID=462991 RepID=A0A1H5WGL6_9VIBR|nr:hypothetical protein [Vibrio hangzhouensis]SEF98416.1 hypothetical protein SAMN04488244_105258 [Vibrio hangzhouensis]
MKIDFTQPSTKKGLVLIGAATAMMAGRPELLTATVTEQGVQAGGLIGTTVPVVLGLWEVLRNEFKGK